VNKVVTESESKSVTAHGIFNRITPSFFLILPAIGWVIYFMVKLVISVWIGWFVMLIRIIKNIQNLKKAKSMEEYIKQKERR